jgi:hypothetical protein
MPTMRLAHTCSSMCRCAMVQGALMKLMDGSSVLAAWASGADTVGVALPLECSYPSRGPLGDKGILMLWRVYGVVQEPLVLRRWLLHPVYDTRAGGVAVPWVEDLREQGMHEDSGPKGSTRGREGRGRTQGALPARPSKKLVVRFGRGEAVMVVHGPRLVGQST